jgi:hypothetical protein
MSLALRSLARSSRARAVALVTEIAVGVPAIGGGYGLLRDAEAMGARRSWLAGSPFDDYTVPGLVLLVVVGGGMLASAAVTIASARAGRLASGVMAVVLAGWGIVETATIGWRGWTQVVLVVLFVAVPAIVLGLVAAAGRGGPCDGG